jgi:hypothetical protein
MDNDQNEDQVEGAEIEDLDVPEDQADAAKGGWNPQPDPPR